VGLQVLLRAAVQGQLAGAMGMGPMGMPGMPGLPGAMQGMGLGPMGQMQGEQTLCVLVFYESSELWGCSFRNGVWYRDSFLVQWAWAQWACRVCLACLVLCKAWGWGPWGKCKVSGCYVLCYIVGWAVC
jgi:hypothetical protein